jgi:hypothetical protein
MASGLSERRTPRARPGCRNEEPIMAESRLADRTPAFWKEVEADYADNKLTLPALCEKHDLTLGEFNYAKLSLGWARRKATPVSRKTLIKRLFGLVDRMTAKLEEDMSNSGEKEVNVLTRLVTTMGRLIEIEGATDKLATPKQTKDMHDIRNKLVQRIEELKRS